MFMLRYSASANCLFLALALHLVFLSFPWSLRAEDAEIEHYISCLSRKASAKDVNNKNEKSPEAANAYMAVNSILLNGERSIDSLVSHFDDAEHCCTLETLSGETDLTVGKMCYLISCRILCPHEATISVFTKEQLAKPWKNKDGFVEWWKKKKNDPIWALQLEVLNEQVEIVENLDAASYRTRFAGEKRLSKLAFEAEKQQILKELFEMRGYILSFEKPHIQTKIFDNTVEMQGLPWNSGFQK
jgi:hypothetical protein